MGMFDDPFGYMVDIVARPIEDGLSVIEGLSEGEIRTRAAVRLGATVVASMAISDIVSALLDLDD